MPSASPSSLPRGGVTHSGRGPPLSIINQDSISPAGNRPTRFKAVSFSGEIPSSRSCQTDSKNYPGRLGWEVGEVCIIHATGKETHVRV